MVVLVLLGFFFIFPVGLFFALSWLARRWFRRRPFANATTKITLTGLALYGCLVLVLISGVAAKEIEPNGPLGAFLNRPGGIIAGHVLAWIAFWIANVALAKVGQPSFRQVENRDA